MTEREALKLALEALKYPLNQSHENFNVDMAELLAHRAITAIKKALAQPEQEPVAWMGIDIEGNPNKFRLNFFSGAIPLFTTPEDKSLIATNEKKGSPCPEFWGWLPKAYNFEGDGAFTKYNMEVAFLAGKQSVATNDTSQERVDETAKQRHWVGLTDEEIDQGLLRSNYAFKTAEAWRAGVVFAMTKLKEKNT